MTKNSAGAHYIRRNFDEAAILAVATKLAFESSPSFNESELATIAAMRRAHPQAGDSPDELGAWLAGMNDEQVAGVVSNTKGVLHEMEFVRLENEDGDKIHASLFTNTNHQVTDVEFSDVETGESWEIQLKATDQAAYVQDWLDGHPEGEVAVTSELAERMNLPSTGLSNEELTVRTEDLVDGLLQLNDQSDLWDYFPALTVASIALVVWELWKSPDGHPKLPHLWPGQTPPPEQVAGRGEVTRLIPAWQLAPRPLSCASSCLRSAAGSRDA